MKKKINEIYLKVSGRFPIDRKIEAQKDTLIEMKVDKAKREILENNDGSVDIVEVCKITSIDKIK